MMALTIATVQPSNYLPPRHSRPEQGVLAQILFALSKSRFHHHTVRENSGVVEEHTAIIVRATSCTDECSGDNVRRID